MLLGIYNGKIGHALHFDTDCKKLSPPTVVARNVDTWHAYAESATVGSIDSFKICLLCIIIVLGFKIVWMDY